MKKIKGVRLCCSHYVRDGYGYDLCEGEELLLCEQCHVNLAGELLKQLAIMVFMQPMVNELLEKKK